MIDINNKGSLFCPYSERTTKLEQLHWDKEEGEEKKTGGREVYQQLKRLKKWFNGENYGSHKNETRGQTRVIQVDKKTDIWKWKIGRSDRCKSGKWLQPEYVLEYQWRHNCSYYKDSLQIFSFLHGFYSNLTWPAHD